MSRSPTNYSAFGQPITPIQPTASPTDQFFQPGVKPPDSGEWFTLARTLSVIEPKLNAIFDQQAAALNEGAQKQAYAKYVELKQKNVDGFKQAVQQGLIGETENPYFTRTIQQLFASDTVAKAKDQAFNDYLADPGLRYSTDPNQVRTFFNDRMTSAMHGMNPWESEVAVPYAQQSVNQLMQRHALEADENRQQEMETDRLQPV